MFKTIARAGVALNRAEGGSKKKKDFRFLSSLATAARLLLDGSGIGLLGLAEINNLLGFGDSVIACHSNEKKRLAKKMRREELFKWKMD